jgi:hypothetical protein
MTRADQYQGVIDRRMHRDASSAGGVAAALARDRLERRTRRATFLRVETR